MDNISVDSVISRAGNWTLEGDCILQSWMEAISENLIQRTNATLEGLQDLNNNAKRTTTALNNVANSLQQLQYTQFVESCCQEDDGVVMDSKVFNIENQDSPPKQLMQEFLRNNLKMLHNCHEKYAVDFDDSEDEDTANNFLHCVYQLRNPYNDRVLPHIIGSKLWSEEWHAGLIDDNDYSGDDASETSSIEQNETSESQSSNLSAWTSSISTLNERTPTDISVLNPTSIDSSIPESNRSFPIPYISALPKSLTKDPSSDSNLFDALGCVSPNTSIVPAHKLIADVNKEYENRIQVLDDTRQLHNVNPHNFNENTRATSSGSSSAIEYKKESQYQIHPIDLHKTTITAPTEIVSVDLLDNAVENFGFIPKQQINEKADSAPTDSILEDQYLPQFKKDKHVTNLFDDLDFTYTPLRNDKESETESKSIINVENKKLNLFDNPDIDDTLFENIASERKGRETNIKKAKTHFTTKNLFDDDEDDFLNIFGSKKFNISESLERNVLLNKKENNEAKNSSEKLNELLNDIVSESTDNVSDKNIIRSLVTSVHKDKKIHTKISFDDDFEVSQPTFINNDELAKGLNTDQNSIEKNVCNVKTDIQNEGFEEGKSYAEQSPNILLDSKIQNTLSEISCDINNETEYDKPHFEQCKNTVPKNAEFLAESKQILTDDKSEWQIKPQYLDTQGSVLNDIPDSAQPIVKSLYIEPNTSTEQLRNMNNCSNIFFDELPPDDDFFQSLHTNTLSSSILTIESEQNYFSPRKDEIGEKNSFSNTNYTSLSLFNDIPPDDYESSGDAISTSIEEERRDGNVYYNGTIKNTVVIKSPTEPIIAQTISDNDKSQKNVIDNNVIRSNLKEIHASNFESQGNPALPIDGTISKNIAEELPDTNSSLHTEAVLDSTETVESTKSSKLSKFEKLNINVQALLPQPIGKLNTKDTLTRPTMSYLTTSPHFNTVLEETNDAPQRNNRGDAGNHEYILTNVCKNRVRPPAKRPSTRKGRLENYHKYLQNDKSFLPAQCSEYIQEINTHYLNLPKNGEKQVSDVSSSVHHLVNEEPLHIHGLQEMQDEFKTAKECLRNESKDAVIKSMKSLKPTELSKVSDVLISFNERHNSGGNLTRLESDDDDDDDLFKVATKSSSKVRNVNLEIGAVDIKPINTNKKHNITSIFGSDDDDSDEFLSTLNNSKQKSLDRRFAAKGTQKPKVNNSKHLFSDVDSDDDDDIFGTNATKAKASKSSASIVRTAQVDKDAEKHNNELLENNPLADLLSS